MDSRFYRFFATARLMMELKKKYSSYTYTESLIYWKNIDINKRIQIKSLCGCVFGISYTDIVHLIGLREFINIFYIKFIKTI